MSPKPDKTEKNLTLGIYLSILFTILGTPGRFFAHISDYMAFRKTIVFLALSGLFFTVASFPMLQGKVMTTIPILFLNAIGMPFITAVVAFGVLRVFALGHVSFQKFFAVYAFSSGTMLLASWIPVIGILTEPWKWLLIISGMKNGCGIGLRHTLLITAITIAVLISGFLVTTGIINHVNGFH